MCIALARCVILGGGGADLEVLQTMFCRIGSSGHSLTVFTPVPVVVIVLFWLWRPPVQINASACSIKHGMFSLIRTRSE